MSIAGSVELGTLTPFRYICQMVLPAVYDDSLSYYELLCKVIKKLNEVIELNNEQSEAYNELYKLFVQLKADFDKFIEGGFEDYYEGLLEAWIDAHMEEIISRAIKMVFFGLTNDGYFCAYIPKSWSGIRFDTVADYSSDDYGKLVLSY